MLRRVDRSLSDLRLRSWDCGLERRAPRGSGGRIEDRSPTCYFLSLPLACIQAAVGGWGLLAQGSRRAMSTPKQTPPLRPKSRSGVAVGEEGCQIRRSFAGLNDRAELSSRSHAKKRSALPS